MKSLRLPKVPMPAFIEATVFRTLAVGLPVFDTCSSLSPLRRAYSTAKG